MHGRATGQDPGFNSSPPEAVGHAQGGRTSFQLVTSRGFLEWLDAERLSLAVTTYQVGKLLLFGVKPDGRMSIHASSFDRATGLWIDGDTMWLATNTMFWRLENQLAEGHRSGGYERVYQPRTGFLTGELDIHDVSADGQGRPVFVNTRFGCLARPDDRRSFLPIWKPPFLSELCPEDRCHLNGLAMQDGEPRFVTLCGQSDVVDGWRDHKATGGASTTSPPASSSPRGCRCRTRPGSMTANCGS